MKHIIRTSSCIAAALALGGCQNFITALGFGPKDSAQVEQRAEVFGSEELERGRLAMKAGYTAMAIQQFRLAALNEKYAADAFNGLGVAYATLGRADLAERYFRSALELDSTNPKYAANLARFYNSELGNSRQALALRDREAAETFRRAEIAAAQQGLTTDLADIEVEGPGMVALALPAPQTSRINGYELQIMTAPEAERSGDLAEVSVRNDSEATLAETTAETATNKAPQRRVTRSRITLIGSAPAKQEQAEQEQAKPARITVSRAGGRWASRPRAASYPVRVALKRKD